MGVRKGGLCAFSLPSSGPLKILQPKYGTPNAIAFLQDLKVTFMGILLPFIPNSARQNRMRENAWPEIAM